MRASSHTGLAFALHDLGKTAQRVDDLDHELDQRQHLGENFRRQILDIGPRPHVDVAGRTGLPIQLVGHVVLADEPEQLVHLQAEQAHRVVTPARQQHLRLDNIDQLRSPPEPVGHLVRLDQRVRLFPTVVD